KSQYPHFKSKLMAANTESSESPATSTSSKSKRKSFERMDNVPFKKRKMHSLLSKRSRWIRNIAYLINGWLRLYQPLFPDSATSDLFDVFEQLTKVLGYRFKHVLIPTLVIIF